MGRIGCALHVQQTKRFDTKEPTNERERERVCRLEWSSSTTVQRKLALGGLPQSGDQLVPAWQPELV